MAQKVRGKVRPRRAMPKVEANWAQVECVFCHGTGRDPFGVMSPLSTCSVCGGKGTVRVTEPYVPCCACDRTGIQPFTRLTCLGCGGKGVVTVRQPTETCPVCNGTGIGALNLHCLHCSGAGVISKREA